MKICFICNQIAAWGKIGGFGTATRALGSALASRGVEVSAVVPRRARDGQPRRTVLDGVEIYGESKWSTLTSGDVFRQIGADVHHSQEPTVASRWAQKAAPEAVHLVTCRDPRDWREHATELHHATWRRRAGFPGTWAYEIAPWVKAAVRAADEVLCPAPCLRPRVRRLYGVDARFVPSPVDLPSRPPVKAERPLVLFVGRWDPRKRVERFFELAANRPEIDFVAVGRAHEPGYDRRVRARGRRVPNLDMVGERSRFGDGGLLELYERAWVLVNCSPREGLPYTFLEALAFGVALLSPLDPDQVVSRFGLVVEDDYERGLDALLRGDAWRQRGREGAGWVADRFSISRSIEGHLETYERLLQKARVRR